MLAQLGLIIVFLLFTIFILPNVLRLKPSRVPPIADSAVAHGLGYATRRDAKSKMEKETKEKNMAEEDINEADAERGSPSLLHCCCPSTLPLACGA